MTPSTLHRLGFLSILLLLLVGAGALHGNAELVWSARTNTTAQRSRRLGCQWSNWAHKMVCGVSGGGSNGGVFTPPAVHTTGAASAAPGASSSAPFIEQVTRASSPPIGWPPRAIDAVSGVGCSGGVNGAVPRHVALVYHGHYDRAESRWGHQCSDFFTVRRNHERQLLGALRGAATTSGGGAVRVSVFFHTYRHATCAAKDAALVAALRPTKHEFSARPLPRIVDSYIRALRLVLQADSGGAAMIDFVVLTRFDVQYAWPVTSLGLDYGKVNLAWRDTEHYWEDPRLKKVQCI